MPCRARRTGRGGRATKVLRAAADALGMVRWSDIGGATTRLPGIDIVNTMEFQGSGTSELGGRAVKTEYHVALGYNPQAMRVEITRTPGRRRCAAHAFEPCATRYAWDESQIGGRPRAGKGHGDAGDRRPSRNGSSISGRFPTAWSRLR